MVNLRSWTLQGVGKGLMFAWYREYHFSIVENKKKEEEFLLDSCPFLQHSMGLAMCLNYSDQEKLKCENFLFCLSTVVSFTILFLLFVVVVFLKFS